MIQTLLEEHLESEGDLIEIWPAHLEDIVWRISLWGNEVESIGEYDPLTGKKERELQNIKIYANSHYVTPHPTINQPIKKIKKDLNVRLKKLKNSNRLLEMQRLEQKTNFDLEMMEITRICTRIENYSKYLTYTKPYKPPPTLFKYLPNKSLIFINKNHITIPQLKNIYQENFNKKSTLANHRFRLPSYINNTPLKFEKFDSMNPLSIFLSPTPYNWEII
jgi:Helicase subunit of the DNA excision repair complex